MDSSSTIASLSSPALTRTRATVVATEATTTGLSATLHLALILAALQRPDVVATFVRGGLALAACMAGLGAGWLVLTRSLRLGRSSDPLDPLWLSTKVGAVGSVLLGFSQVALLAAGWGDESEVTRWLIWSVPIPVVILAVGSLRVLAALEGRSRTPFADILLAASHALLGGLAACLLVGLLSHSLTAEMTYELGVGTSMAALWTSVAAARVIQGARGFLRAERKIGRRWPTSEGGLRSASIVLVLGVLVPATVLVTALLSARLTGVELACVALAVSVHTMRYATVTMRYGVTGIPTSDTSETLSELDEERVQLSSVAMDMGLAPSAQVASTESEPPTRGLNEPNP